MNTLPAELAALLGATDERRAPVRLPPGTTVHADEGDGPPVLWMSDGAADPDIWAQLCSAHDSLGLWPLLLTGLDDDEDFRPWGSGELWLDKLSDPRSHDPQSLLSRWWSTYTAAEEGDDERDVARCLAVTAPYGQIWPGLAPAAAVWTSAGERAVAYAAELLAADPSMRLGLVPAGSGAEALRECLTVNDSWGFQHGDYDEADAAVAGDVAAGGEVRAQQSGGPVLRDAVLHDLDGGGTEPPAAATWPENDPGKPRPQAAAAIIGGVVIEAWARFGFTAAPVPLTTPACT
ncbi:hypothetical protein ACIP98_41315 [Streptomyces sp. NPDC088354]|uniref:hypothetical protein n=1 Tax=Streptomyces sp. NPDC088354 TaxID=3365856 RepID=UPI00382EED1B